MIQIAKRDKFPKMIGAVASNYLGRQITMVLPTLSGIQVADTWLPVRVPGLIRYEEFTHCLISCYQFTGWQLENGYAIWDFRGQELMKQIQDRFKQFIWRPRPPTLLTKDQQKKIRRNLREYSRTFDEEDAAEESNVSAELVALRKRLVDEWNAWRALRKRELTDERGHKSDRHNSSSQEKEEIEVWVDEVIEQIEEIVD